MDDAEDDEAHPSRNKLRTEMLRAGWPDSSSYSKSITHYGDRMDAIVAWEGFLSDIADACLMKYIDKDLLLHLGGLARVNVPRALNLIGYIPSEEGGEEVIPALPDYGQWPVLATDPESGG